jgi:hypothetical protein
MLFGGDGCGATEHRDHVIMDTNQYFKLSALETNTDPQIVEFMDAVIDKGYLNFEDLQHKDFMKFWSNIAIHRYEDGDFKYIFYGTNLVANFGSERTGSKVSELNNPIRRRELSDALMEVLNTKRTIYARGDLLIDGKGYHQWQQVKMPLLRGREMNEVISFIIFNPAS